MNIYKKTGEIIEVDITTYQFEAEDRVLLNTRDENSGLRRVVGFEKLTNGYTAIGQNNYIVLANVKCIKESDNKIAPNVAMWDAELKIDETTFVNPLTGDYVFPDESGVYPEGTITEYEFVRNVIHYGTGAQLLRLLFGGIARAEAYNRYV